MARGAKIRVLIVDDSSVVRAVLRRMFQQTPDIEVAGEASDGARAVRAVEELKPDLVLMDIEMPVLDGYGATERIMASRPTPILVITSRAHREGMRIAFEALRRGALEVIPKPEGTAEWETLARSLPDTVRRHVGGLTRLAAKLAARRASEDDAARVPLAADLPHRAIRYVAVGASTGGPGAVRTFLGALPAKAPAAVLIVQHIAPGFEDGLAEWLSRDLGRDVQLARNREEARPGTVRVAPAGSHLRLRPGGVLQIDGTTPPRGGHRPSVDELFFSCAESHPRQVAGVLLTGMGSDGAEGLAALRAAGGLTLVQDEASSVVFGMPRAALERGAAEIALPPRDLASTLARCWRGDDT